MDRNVTVAAQLRYAIAQSNFRIDNVKLPKLIERDITPLIMQIAICFAHYIKENQDMARATRDVERVTIYGKPLKSLLKNPNLTTNHFVKMLQIVLGYPITMSHQVDNVTFSPVMKGQLRLIKTKSMNEVYYTTCQGEETVYFRQKETMGSFMHNGSHIHHINLNFTNHKDLADALSHIAEYVRYNWDVSKKTTKGAIRQEWKSKVKQYSWNF